MSNIIKKKVVVVLAAVLCLSLLAGCGSHENEISPLWNEESTMDNVKSYDTGMVKDPNVSSNTASLGDSYDTAQNSILGFEGETDIPSNTNKIDGVDEKGYMSAVSNPLSTFAADVDTSSYTWFRKTVREAGMYGDFDYKRDLKGLRVEEMVNYFHYHYPIDKSKDFTFNTEIIDTPWNPDTKLMITNVKARELSEAEKTGSNLVFLIDTSGSMEGEDRLDLVKKGLNMLMDTLTSEDTISIVTYAGSAETLLEGAKGDDKDTIKKAIKSLSADGGTNGGEGIIEAYRIAEANKAGHSNSRVIVCSDGDWNMGAYTSNAELEDLISEKKELGVYITVLGFGWGNYNDSMMEKLADKGNGNYYFIDCEEEAKRVLVDEISSTLVTIGDDVKFQIEFNPAYIKGYRQVGYENRTLEDSDFNDDTKDGGEVGYGHEVTVVYELVMQDSAKEIVESDLKYQDKPELKNDTTDWLTLSCRYKPHGEKESQLIETVVNEDNYTTTPSEDSQFIAGVVATALLCNASEYIPEDYTVDTIISSIENVAKTEDRDGFVSILKEMK